MAIEETMQGKQDVTCPVCREQEVDRLRRELTDCKKRTQRRDKAIAKLDRKVFVLTMIAIAIGAIFGKEALDTVTEWLGSIGSFNGAAERVTVILPEPATSALFALMLVKPNRRRRK